MVETVRMILKNKGSDVWALPPDRTVYEAIALMAEKGVGTIVVISGEHLVGILSERDYARKVILKGKLSKETLVSEIMSSPVMTVEPEWTADECMRLMTKKRIRHLPVMDQGSLAGIVSIGDLVKAIVSVQAETIQYLSDYIEGKHTNGPIPVPVPSIRSR